jgi:hypothetical protein
MPDLYPRIEVPGKTGSYFFDDPVLAERGLNKDPYRYKQ